MDFYATTPVRGVGDISGGHGVMTLMHEQPCVRLCRDTLVNTDVSFRRYTPAVRRCVGMQSDQQSSAPFEWGSVKDAMILDDWVLIDRQRCFAAAHATVGDETFPHFRGFRHTFIEREALVIALDLNPPMTDRSYTHTVDQELEQRVLLRQRGLDYMMMTPDERYAALHEISSGADEPVTLPF